jgi:MFS family permease
LRGTGFGAFNLASVVFGSAAAPLVTSAIATQFGNNYRTAFLIILPVAFLGAGCLLLARRHIERDAAKVFEAVATAIAVQQAEDAATSSGSGTDHEEGAAVGDT